MTDIVDASRPRRVVPANLSPQAYARFISRISFPSDDFWAECWVWKGCTNGSGYGSFSYDGHMGVLVHRLAYTIWRGPIPAGCTVDHLCFTPPCVNPTHLDACPFAENNRRSFTYNGRVSPQAGKTHCARGHEFTDDNTYRWGGKRYCRQCQRLGYHRRKATS